jgi:hypothetical protein
MHQLLRKLICIYVLNLLVLKLILTAQQLVDSLPVRHSLIAGTEQPFLYIHDFKSMVYGDVFFVPLILNAFLFLVEIRLIAGKKIWTIIIVGSCGLAVAFLSHCLGPNHKPDYGFPATGVVSAAGFIHAFYLGFCVQAGLIALILAPIIYRLSKQTFWLGILGLIGYMATIFLDVQNGNFAALHTIP